MSAVQASLSSFLREFDDNPNVKTYEIVDALNTEIGIRHGGRGLVHMQKTPKTMMCGKRLDGKMPIGNPTCIKCLQNALLLTRSDSVAS